ncbi:hypothetical protein [Salipiger pallidus]|nr:hypothetical protein [Salipiger pallidus]
MITPFEKAGLDPDRLEELYAQMGPRDGEDMLCRAMEELAYRLGQADRLHADHNYVDMRKCTRALRAIADQIGMSGLAHVAGHVVQCIDDGDAVALSATLARMSRIGERSLYAIWDLQDLSL